MPRHSIHSFVILGIVIVGIVGIIVISTVSIIAVEPINTTTAMLMLPNEVHGKILDETTLFIRGK